MAILVENQVSPYASAGVAYLASRPQLASRPNAATANIEALLADLQQRARAPVQSPAPLSSPAPDGINALIAQLMQQAGAPQPPPSPYRNDVLDRPDSQSRDRRAAMFYNLANQQAQLQQAAQSGDTKILYGLVSQFLEGNQRERLGEQDLQQQLVRDAAAIERQAATQAGIEDRQQQLAEMQANLQQRNRLMREAPGAFGPGAGLTPEALADAAAGIQAKREAMVAPSREALWRLQQGIAEGDPQAIQEGVRRGILSFTPQQRTAINQVRDAMDKVATDPSFTPAERAAAESQLAQQLNAIRPHEVPLEEQPRSPMEQFQADMLTVPDPTTGLSLNYKQKVRNGAKEWVLDDSSKKHLELWKDLELARQKKAEGLAGGDDDFDKRYDAAVASLKKKNSDQDNYILTPQAIESEMRLRDQIRASMEGGQVAPTATAAPSGSMFDEPEPPAPPPASGPQRPIWETLPPLDHGAGRTNSDIGKMFFDGSVVMKVEFNETGIFEQGYIPVMSPEDIKNRNLPPGTPIILPDGRTARVK